METKATLSSRGPSAVAMAEGMTVVARQGTKFAAFHAKPWRAERALDVEEFCAGPVWAAGGSAFELTEEGIFRTDVQSMYREEIPFEARFPVSVARMSWFASGSVLYCYRDFVFYRVDPGAGRWEQLNERPQNTRLQSAGCHPEWLNDAPVVCGVDGDTVLVLGRGVGARYVQSQNKFKLFKSCVESPGRGALWLNSQEVALVQRGALVAYNHGMNRTRDLAQVRGAVSEAFPGAGKGCFAVVDGNGQVQAMLSEEFQQAPEIAMKKQETQTGVDSLSFIMEATEAQMAEQAAQVEEQAQRKRRMMASLGGFI